MFGVGISELLLILVVAFVVVGPERLPKIARSLGRGLYEIRRATEEVREEIEKEGSLLDDPLSGKEADAGAKKDRR